MAREPVEPTSSRDVHSPAGAGAPAGSPPATWEPDDTASPAVGTWDVDNGDAEAVPSGALPVSKDTPGDDKSHGYEGLHAAFPVRKEPWRLSHMMFLIVVAAVAMWIWVTLGMMAIVLAVLGAIVLAITAVFVLARMSAARQNALLSILAIAARRDLPLAPAVAAFADQFGGRYQGRVLNVAADLNAGTPLPDSLQQNRTNSRDTILMARVGHDAGLLARALELAGSARASQAGAWSSTASRLAYLLVVILIAEGISGFLAYFIVPKMQSIFRDFQIPLPEVTVICVRFTQAVSLDGPLAALIVLAEVACLLYIPFSFGGWMNYRVPILDRLLSRRHAALVLRALSVTVEANQPIVTGLATLAEHYPAGWVRRRLARAHTDARLGADWIDALWRSGVLRKSDAEVLASAATVGNLPWACRELADTAERRQQLRMQVLSQTLFPLAVIVIGLAIAVLAVGYFLPVVTLIQRLTDQ